MFVPSAILVIIAIVLFLGTYMRTTRGAALSGKIFCIELAFAALALAYFLQGLYAGDSPFWHAN